MKIEIDRPAAPGGVAHDTRAYRRAASAARPAALGDNVTVLGLPETELTPKVRTAFSQLLHEVDGLRGELDQARKRIDYLERLADQDALLPVINRRAFVRHLSRVMSYVARYGTPHSVLFFDVNDMKSINDTLGHAAGDATLTHVAKSLVDEVRESDLVARLGGDEFGVLLAQADQAVAEEKAAMLAESVHRTPLVWEGRRIPVSVAYGSHTLTADDDPRSALSSADRKMYAHKRGAA